MSTATATRNGQKTDDKRVNKHSHLRWVPIAQTKVSPLAQRKYRPEHAEHIAQDFDPDHLGFPVVNLRDDIFWLIDGQHRIAAMKLMGWEDQSILCECFEGLTETQEAEEFLRRQDRLNLRRPEEFGVAVVADREIEREIDRLVRAQELRVGTGGDGYISAVSTITKIYLAGGDRCLSRTLRIVADAYGGGGLKARPLSGVGLVVQRYGAELDDKFVVQKLANALGGLGGLMTKAQGIRKQYGRPFDQSVAAAVVEIVNAGRGGKKLPDWFK